MRATLTHGEPAKAELSHTLPAMSDLEPTTERRTLKGRPVFVLIALIGSCYAIGYAIYRLLKGMRL